MQTSLFPRIATALLLLVSLCNAASAQTADFKTYTDAKNHFSFEIPATWSIVNDTAAGKNFLSVCKPTLKEELESYDECFDGIVFYVLLYKGDLTKTLEELGGYKKLGDTYYTSDRISDGVKTIYINGINWSGLYHRNICGILCDDSGFHGSMGECEFYYFSNGHMTICITTTGRSLDEQVKAKLLTTFKFN